MPRLVLGNRAPHCEPEGLPVQGTLVSVDTVVELALGGDAAALSSSLAQLHERGASVEAIYLTLLAPAARRLGERCAEDRCDGALVAAALSQLRCAMHELAPAFYAERELVTRARRVLVAPVPCATQICGVTMVDSFEAAMTAEFFRRAGWDVWSDNFCTTDELLRVLKEHRFDLAVLTTGCAARLDNLAEVVPAVRRRTRNGEIAVLVGGRALHQHPQRALDVGADGTALDAADAVSQADRLGLAAND